MVSLRFVLIAYKRSVYLAIVRFKGESDRDCICARYSMDGLSRYPLTLMYSISTSLFRLEIISMISTYSLMK